VFHFLQASSRRRYSFPLILLIICVLSFGLLILWLGFYWDDLPFVWMMNFLRPTDLILLDNNRPLSGWLFFLLFPLLRNSALRWQIFNLANRYLLGLSAWWSLSSIFKAHRKKVEWLAVLIVLNPSFELQFISINSSRHILALVLILLSFGLTAKAARGRDRYRLITTLALGASIASMLMSDYFYTLELLRPFFLFNMQKDPEKRIAGRVLKALGTWTPYLLCLIVIGVWRFFLIEQIYYPLASGASPGEGGIASIQLNFSTIVSDIVQVGFTAWKNAFQFPDINEIGKKMGLLAWMVIGLVTLLTFVYFWFSPGENDTSARRYSDRVKVGFGLILLGILGMVLGGIPAWAGALPIRIYGVQSRLALPMILGASFTIVGASSFIQPRKLGTILLALTAGFAAGRAVQTAAEFRFDYERQRSFFWELYWRVPGLEKGTVILTNELPFLYETDNSITPIFNWLYESEQTTYQMEYMVYDIKLRLGHRLPSLESGQPLNDVYRKFSTGRELTFVGSTSQVLVISYTYPSCLRVIQPVYDGHMTGFTSAVVHALDLSDPNLIQPNSRGIAAGLFEIYDPEPEPDWCYYYEKADLARQFGDWEKVYQLTEEALSLSSSPNHPSEYVLFIEALGRMGDYSRALELTQRVLDRDPALDRMLCDAWERVEAATRLADSDPSSYQDARSRANCK